MLERVRCDVTRAKAVSERKSLRKFDFFSFAVCTTIKRRASDNETKNIAGRIPETTRSRTVTILTFNAHSTNYNKHFETTTGKISCEN